MKINACSTVFQVVDLKAALAFYVDLLGFKEDFRYDDYAGVSRDEMYLHLCAHTTWNRPVGGGAVSVFCDEVEEFHARVKALGAKIESAPADQQYGLRDFVLRDPDGNVLTFGCSLSTE